MRVWLMSVASFPDTLYRRISIPSVKLGALGVATMKSVMGLSVVSHGLSGA